MGGKIHTECILHLKLVMSPHSLGVSKKYDLPKCGWEEIGWNHESWPSQGANGWSNAGILFLSGIIYLVKKYFMFW